MKLHKALQAHNTIDFKSIVKNEIQALEPDLLPLQQGLSLSSYVGNAPFTAIILNSFKNETSLQVKVGVFYTGIIAGCSCSDDPTPTDEQNEYCEMQFIINNDNAETKVILLNSG